MAELDTAIDWALQRKPTHFLMIPETNYYLWVTDKLIVVDIPQLRILFSIDETNNTIHLHRISIV